MALPSINIGIGKKGLELIEHIDNHFSDHEPVLHKLILSASLSNNDDAIDMHLIKEGKTIRSEKAGIQDWFEKELYAEINNLETVRYGGTPNKIIINIVVPVFDGKETLSGLLELLSIIKELYENELISGISVRIFSVIYPLEDNVQTNDNSVALKKFTEEVGSFSNIIHDIYYIDDRNMEATMLQLDEKWLAFALSEFFIYQIFEPGSLAIQNKNKIFGLSIIHFNEVLFRKVISLNILNYKLQQEKINEEGVTVEEIINKTNPFIEKHSNFLDNFIERFPDNNENRKNNVNNVKTYLSDFKDSLKDFLTDKNYTVAEAKVILANIIGEDDKLLTGVQWSNERLNLKDLEFDIIEYFNQFLPEDEKVDRQTEKSLREQISDLQNGIKREETSLKTINENIDEIESDIEISFEEGIFNVNGKRINASGYIPSPIDPNDEVYQYVDSNIPKQVDLSSYWDTIKDQGQLGSCSAFPVAAVYEFAAKNNNKNVDISELFIYYNSRKLTGRENEDSGSTLIDSIRAVKEHGACYSSTYPYNIENFTLEPDEKAYEEAMHQVVDRAVRVNINEKDFKHAAYNGYPIIFGLKLYESFYPRNSKGVVPYPSPNEQQNKNHSHHAMLIVGFNDDEKLFKVRNSWGTQFGDNGYCYIPYDYLANPDYCSEAFIITEIADLSFEEFSYSTSVSFSFLNDLMLKKKIILEQQIREKKRVLKNKRGQFDIVVIDNESNIEHIKDPLFRKHLFEKLKSNQASQNLTSTSSAQIEGNKSSYWIWGGLAITLLSIFLYPVLLPLGALFTIAGMFSIVYGLYLKNKTRINDNASNATVNNEIEEQIKKDLYKFQSADKLFEGLELLYNDLIKRYKTVARYYDSLKKWQKDITEEIKAVDYKTPTFVFNLVKEKPLNEYIDKNKDVFIQELPNLMEVFYEKSEQDDSVRVEKIFSSLKKEYLNNIKNNIDKITNISVINYLLGNIEYEFFNNPQALSYLCPSLFKISKPFCNLRLGQASKVSQHFILREDLKSREDKQYKATFNTQRDPASIPIEITRNENRKKLTHIQITALDSIEDIVRY